MGCGGCLITLLSWRCLAKGNRIGENRGKSFKIWRFWKFLCKDDKKPPLIWHRKVVSPFPANFFWECCADPYQRPGWELLALLMDDIATQEHACSGVPLSTHSTMGVLLHRG